MHVVECGKLITGVTMCYITGSNFETHYDDFEALVDYYKEGNLDQILGGAGAMPPVSARAHYEETLLRRGTLADAGHKGRIGAGRCGRQGRAAFAAVRGHHR